MTSRTRPCDLSVAKLRLKKAEEFHRIAEEALNLPEEEGDFGDVYVTLCVHAGIAAADAICCRGLGEHAQGESHAEAAALLKRVKPDGNELATALGVLLGMKTRAGYSAERVNAESRKRAGRAADKLLVAARDRLGGGP